MKSHSYQQRRSQKSGFALIASLSIMAFLVLIAVALYSLSSVATKSAAIAAARTEAQANAKMALMLAIGDLQKYTGADTRVTAPANIIIDDPDPENNPTVPAVVGAWKSWEGLNHVRDVGDPARGRPVAEVDGESIYDLKDDPSTSGNGRFLSWLVSGANEGELDDGSGGFPGSIIFNLPTTTAGGVETVPLLTAAKESGGSSGSLQYGDKNEIHVVPTESEDGTRYAWWVSPENQKARLQQPYSPRSDDIYGWSDLAKSYSVPDPGEFALASQLLPNPENFNELGSNGSTASKALNVPSIALLNPDNSNSETANPQLKFHDFSTTATGLLTNTATGGWRKDMSVLTDQWINIYSNYSGSTLPLFRLSPSTGDTTSVPLPDESDYSSPQSLLHGFYPWSDYHLLGGNQNNFQPLTYNTACASWQSLVNFATKYKDDDLSYDSGSRTASFPVGWKSILSKRFSNYNFQPSDFYNHLHNHELNPVIARIQFIIQANAVRDPNFTDSSGNTVDSYLINLRIVPVYTLWNPYNVELTKVRLPNSEDRQFGIGTLRSLPVVMAVTNAKEEPNEADINYKFIFTGRGDGVDGSTGSTDDQLQANKDKGYEGAYFKGVLDTGGWLPYDFSLKPGEAKLFTPNVDTPGSNNPGDLRHFAVVLLEDDGYVPGGAGIPLCIGNKINDPVFENAIRNRLVKVQGRANNELQYADSVRFSVRADRHTKIFSNNVTNLSGAGTFFAVGTHKNKDGRSGYIANKNINHMRSIMMTNVDDGWAQQYWPPDELDIAEYPVSNLTPGGGNEEWTNIFTVSFGPRISFGAASGDSQNRPTKGLVQSSPFVSNAFSIPTNTEPAYHPVNGAYEISYFSMRENDDLTPEIGELSYIATGFQSGDGLSRLIMAEIPLRPMASLAELQHWNLRGKNPSPPFQFNLIGNSDATPLIEQDSILAGDPLRTDVATNFQHDDAYCANHLLFDDWFLTSIAEEPATFGNNEARSALEVYQDFLEGNTLLTNRAYLPIPDDRNLSSSEASSVASDIVTSSTGDGFLKVASRFEVQGMFNVNSTSIPAWRALLGHATQHKVAHHDLSSGIALSGNVQNSVVSRHTVAADTEAGTTTAVMNPNDAPLPASEYLGYRTLDDDQLDELAAKIVDEVRARGPFLSLSEFINRQLSDNEDLALAGALQSALNNLSEDNNPMALLDDDSEGLSSETMEPDDIKIEGNNYAFDKASEGRNIYGLPGYIRQADILRPIAPIISARDDTFTIRAYGDKRDEAGKIIARAWCEAVVQRNRDFVDPIDKADRIEPPASAINELFGRQYRVTSFRWISEDEV